MKQISYLLMILIGCILTFTACSDNKQKSADSEETLVVEEKEDDVSDIANRTLAKAETEAMMARRKISERFDKLFEAQTKLAEAKEHASQFETGTSDYTYAQRQVESAQKTLQDILDDVNGRYAQILGFLLLESFDKSLLEAARDKIEAQITVEILKKYKQIALDEIEYEYTGVMPEDY